MRSLTGCSSSLLLPQQGNQVHIDRHLQPFKASLYPWLPILDIFEWEMYHKQPWELGR